MFDCKKAELRSTTTNVWCIISDPAGRRAPGCGRPGSRRRTLGTSGRSLWTDTAIAECKYYLSKDRCSYLFIFQKINSIRYDNSILLQFIYSKN